MAPSLHDPGSNLLSKFWRDESYLRQEIARIAADLLRTPPPAGSDRLEALLARTAADPDAVRAERTAVAASTASLPITSEMAWAVPQLLKRIQLVSPGTASTSGALRALFNVPWHDEAFASAFAASGFLSSDRVVGQARWKYDFKAMKAKHDDGSAWEVLEHCRALLAQHRDRQPVDWDAALAELRTLRSWFPELRTVGLLEQLYARLHALNAKSILAVRSWLEWRADMAGRGLKANAWNSAGGIRPGPFRCERSMTALTFQGVRYA
jgi:hypothetical protein